VVTSAFDSRTGLAAFQQRSTTKGTMRHPHNGVLLPAELDSASMAERDAYAADVKRSNAAFNSAYHALDDQARTLGYAGIDDLVDNA
jgi:hypothetical protein